MLHSGGALAVEPRVWVDRLTAALDRRHGLVDDPLTTAWRWVHGENDGLPGLVLDRYVDTLVIKLYSGAWYPHLGDIIAAAQKVLQSERVVLRCARRVSPPADAPGDGDVLVGSQFDGTLTYLERGLTMSADVRRGNKTGAFLDQRDNRTLVGAACDGARVLDVFTATGGFALAAAAGGARSVHLVDISQPAIDVAKANIEQNRNIAAVRRCEITSQRGDAFNIMESLAASGEQFDVVIIDPPSFAQNEKSIPKALSSYRRLARAGLRLTVDGGLLVQASCSSRITIDELGHEMRTASREVGRPFMELRRTGHAIDHPIGFSRGAYLKALYAAVAASV
jgi:23S rRNA (cytosine1962-C5)-methyltransferase